MNILQYFPLIIQQINSSAFIKSYRCAQRTREVQGGTDTELWVMLVTCPQPALFVLDLIYLQPKIAGKNVYPYATLFSPTYLFPDSSGRL